MKKSKGKKTYNEKLRDKIIDVLDIVVPFEWPDLEKEYQFMHSRGWRFDYAIVLWKIGIEYQGGAFRTRSQDKVDDDSLQKKSGHNSIYGQTRDWEKFNEAQIRGWIVICVNPKTIDNGTFVKQLERAIKVRKGDIRYA